MSGPTNLSAVDAQRKLLPAHRVRVHRELQPLGVPPLDAAKGPKIDLIQQDGVVQAIDVTCPCGKRLRLICEYS